jgi:hypothetical protein
MMKKREMKLKNTKLISRLIIFLQPATGEFLGGLQGGEGKVNFSKKGGFMV